MAVAPSHLAPSSAFLGATKATCARGVRRDGTADLLRCLYVYRYRRTLPTTYYLKRPRRKL